MRFAHVLLGMTVAMMTGFAWAGWNGAGVPGGTGGTNINDTANWSGGVIDGDYSGITSNAALQLTADHTLTNGLSFGTLSSTLYELTINGTNTLTLNTNSLPAYSGSHVLLPSNALSTVTFGKGLTLNLTPKDNRYLIGAGQLAIDSLVKGPGGFRMTSLAGGGISLYLRNKLNSFTGQPSPIAGVVYFTSLANSGVASALGAGTSIYIQTCRYSYIGARDGSSNRRLYLYTTPVLQNDSACGAISLSGDATLNNKATTVYLGGLSSGTNLFAGALADYNASFLTALVKNGSGTWRLTGTNTFTGKFAANNITVSGGALIADYMDDAMGAGSNRVFMAGHSVWLSNGELNLRGKTGAGNTTFQKLGIVSADDYSANRLVVDGNGGDGTIVELASFDSSGTSSLLLMDLQGNALLRTTNAIPTGSGTVQMINGMIMNNVGEDALFHISDANGQYGFAAQDAAYKIVRHTNAVALAESNASTYAGDHLSLTSDVTRTADLSFSTLVLDARANAVTLDMGGKNIQTSNSSKGRGIIAYGSYPVTVMNGAHGAQASSYIFNYGTGKFTWNISNSKVYTVGGTGLIELAQPINVYFTVMGGTARLTTNMLYTTGTIRLLGKDGVLELGADLNGEAPGDFTGTLGSSSGGIVFYAGGCESSGGGFSAYGRDRTVNLGGAGAKLTWGVTTSFLRAGSPFILSSPYANATLIFENELDVGSDPREIRVRNGSATIDARLTGAISGGYFSSSLVKSGDGTLELTGPQTYRGNVSVVGGGLRLGADDIYTVGRNDLVLKNATLDAAGKRNSFGSLEILDNSTINLDASATELAFADSREVSWTGTLTLTGKLGANTLRFGTDGQGLSIDQQAAIMIGSNKVRLDGQGYVQKIPQGTCLTLQ